MQLRPPSTLSPSKLSEYEKCPLSYYLSVIIEPLVPEILLSAVLGQFVHKILETVFAFSPGERVLDAAKKVSREVYDTFSTEPNFVSLNLSEKDQKKFRWDAWSLVEKYFDLEDPNQIVAVGQEVWVKKDFDGILMRGIIDRLDVVNNEIEIVDYKTGKIPPPGYEQKRMQAMFIYSLLVEDILGVRPKKLKLLYLSKPKVIIATPKDVTNRAVENRIRKIASKIKANCDSGVFDPTPNKLCNWCQWKPSCPAYNGDLQAMLAEADETGMIKKGKDLRPLDEEPELLVE